MAALSANRDTPKMQPVRFVRSHLVAAGVHLYAGAIAVINAAGYLEPATAAAAKIAAGIVVREVDNTSGANGAVSAEVFEVDGAKVDGGTSADAVAQANVGALMYALDDHTVSPVSTSRSAVGYLVKLDPVDGSPWIRVTLANA